MLFTNCIRVAWRNLKRHRGYTAINVVGLSVGMACCLLILLYVQDERAYDRYHEKADLIVRLVGPTNAKTPDPLGVTLERAMPDIETSLRMIPTIGSWMMRQQENVFSETRVFVVDASIFKVFTLPLIRGNPSTALEAANSVVISEAMAAKYLGEVDPIGKTIRADDQLDLVVTGVMKNMPRHSHFVADFLIAYPTIKDFFGEDHFRDWSTKRNYTYLLLREGISRKQLEAKIDDWLKGPLGQQLKADRIDLKLSVQALTDIHLYSHLENEAGSNGDITTIWLLSTVAALILIIACINYISLSTARALQRRREVGIRKVSGATAPQLYAQFFGESVLLSCFALMVALSITESTLPYFNALTDKSLALNLSDSPSTVILWLLLVIGAGLAAGAYPALKLARLQPAATLKGSGSITGNNALLRKTLVVVQFAMSIMILIGTGVVADQLKFIRNQRLGFDREQVIVISSNALPVLNRMEPLREELTKYPSIVSMTSATLFPGRVKGQGRTLDFTFQRAAAPQSEPIAIKQISIWFDFVKTLGLELAAGHDLIRDENWTAFNMLLINETAARRLGWRSAEEAIDQRLAYVSLKGSVPVVGVIRDFHLESLHHPIEPLVFRFSGGGPLLVRTAPGQLMAGVEALKEAWEKINPGYPLLYSLMDEDIDRLYRSEARLGTLFGIFSGIALVISGVGLFSLVAYITVQRTKEIGVRKVLGASVTDILSLFSRELVLLIGIAILMAWPAAYLSMQRWLQTFVYRVDLSWAIFIVSGLVAVGVVLIASGYHVLAAARANPVVSLRNE